MKRLGPADLSVFLAIATHRSFRRAAVELGVTPSALSHSLRAVEERIGLRLVNRTTRSVALTEAGERLYGRIKPAFLDIADAIDDLDDLRGKPSGRLRINTARTAAKLVLMPLVPRFLAAYPDIELDIVCDDRFVDVVSAGFDAGIRLGESLAADMVAVPIGPKLRSVIVAAPALVARVGIPMTPHDLQARPCIRMRYLSGAVYRWEFEKGGTELEVEVAGPIALNDMDLIIEGAQAGLGFAYALEADVAAPLADGRLVRVLDDWCESFPGFFLYYASRRQLPAALRAFVDFMKTPAPRRARAR
ncbi:MAG: LysR family transcriptional regulator [Deltaproteobacteria bacterium]|nr:LysR family transcriptional regulator [Nannocystaceae bacterium]